MNRASNYSCPDCGGYLKTDEKNRGWVKCSCGFARKTLQELGRETPPKPILEEPMAIKRRKKR